MATRRIQSLFLLLIVATSFLLTACAQPGDVPEEDLFPGDVNAFFRTDGPYPDPDVDGLKVGTYQGPSGVVTLKVGKIGEENVPEALSVLPGTATDVGPDPALGPRLGVFFTFANEYHAAWGNGDWLFVLSASSSDARSQFLGAYGF